MGTRKRAPQRAGVAKTYKLFIDGRFPRSESGRSLAITDADERFVTNVAWASRKDLRDAVRAARNAVDGWSGRSAFNRGQILYRMAEVLESRRAAFVEALQRDGARKKADAVAEVDAAIDRLVWYSGWSDKFAQVMGTTNPVATPYFNFTLPEPTGVVVVLAPRNAPLLGLVSSIAPVIISGNAAVVVVDGALPTVAIDFAEVLHASDLPGGVVNILTGKRAELQPYAAEHMDVNAVACYGGDADERRALQIAAADNVKRVWLQDDPDDATWREARLQSPYWILPFVEFKTAWHPVGI